MAKSIVLYGVFLGAFICLCSYVTGVGLDEVWGYEVNSDEWSVAGERRRLGNEIDLRKFIGHAGERVILSGTEWSRKSSTLLAPEEQLRSNKTFETTSLKENLIRSKIKKIYSAEIGVREKTGKNDGERVEKYLAVTQLGTGYAWCAAFVSFVFSEAGFPQPRTPWSPALFPKDRVIWDRGKILKPHTPASADVFGIYFSNLKRIAHVGFVDEWGEKYMITVEGNTNEAGSNEGDGVYRKRRPIASIYQVANWIDLEEKL